MIKKTAFLFIDITRAVLVMISVILIYSLAFRMIESKKQELSGIVSLPAAVTDPEFIQQKLFSLGFYDKDVNGVYDAATSEAVRRFQLYLGLDGTGIADEITLDALRELPDSDYSEYDIRLLARLIDAESDDGSWFNMLMVGAEAVRRLHSTAYPDTLAGIVFEQGAFGSVSNGNIWNAPSEKAIRAARDAMRGMLN